jgi:tetratricopeptide (TPR) repeat protein
MLLLESSGRLVRRNTLIDVLWPDEDVGENNLTQHVYLLRKLLEELGGKRSYITTESRRGYRFTPAVAAIDNAIDHFDPQIAAALGDVISGSGLQGFRLYCEGCYQLEKRTHESLLAAAARFSEVIALDPMHWQAHLGVARSYAFLGAYLYAPSKDVFPKAKAAALRALEIRPSAAAHAQLAEITILGEWDGRAAEAAIRTALALQPEAASVHNHAAWVALGMADLDRALYEARAALEIEPASLFYRNVLARVLIHRGDYGNAVDLLSRVLEHDPTIDAAIENLALAYTVSDQPERVIRLLIERAARGPLEDHMTGQFAQAYGSVGRGEEAQRLYSNLIDAQGVRYVAGWPMALAALGLNRPMQAIEHLSRAAREREAVLVFLKTLPLFDELKEFKEFQSLCSVVNS